jgi:hypothetical protein
MAPNIVKMLDIMTKDMIWTLPLDLDDFTLLRKDGEQLANFRSITDKVANVSRILHLSTIHSVGLHDNMNWGNQHLLNLCELQGRIVHNELWLAAWVHGICCCILDCILSALHTMSILDFQVKSCLMATIAVFHLNLHQLFSELF